MHTADREIKVLSTSSIAPLWPRTGIRLEGFGRLIGSPFSFDVPDAPSMGGHRFLFSPLSTTAVSARHRLG